MSSSNQPFDPSRRRLLTGMAATGAAASLTSCSSSGGSAGALPNPQDSGIDHIIVAMMENRSFDHAFGWLPGANGKQAGLTFVDSNGHSQTTFPLASSQYGYQGCGFSDPDHSYDAGHGDYNNGAMDGFLKPQPAGDLFPIGYYTEQDVPFFAECAQNWTIFDAYHTGILSCTLPNRMYMHTGQTDRITNTLTICKLPTIWDSLLAAKVPCRYYYSDTPIIALFQNFQQYKTAGMVQNLSQFAKDFAKGGTPPAVSFVDPYMGLAIGEGLGTSWDDHAFADIRDGQCYLNYLYNVVRNSPVWSKTLLIINYDEWGGFFDHVPPPMGPVSSAESALGNDGRLGIRVPCIAIGPRARHGYIETAQYDPNSILNMICWRFGLNRLGVRGGSSGNMANALDFSSTSGTGSTDFNSAIQTAYGSSGPFPTQSPFTHTPNPSSSGTFGGLCSKNSASSEEAWRQYEQHYAEVRGIQELGRQNGLDI